MLTVTAMHHQRDDPAPDPGAWRAAHYYTWTRVAFLLKWYSQLVFTGTLPPKAEEELDGEIKGGRPLWRSRSGRTAARWPCSGGRRNGRGDGESGGSGLSGREEAMMLAVACAVGDDEPDRLAAHALPAALRREHFWTPRRVKWALLYYEDIQAGKRPPRDPREPATGSRYFRWGWWERLADLRHDINGALDWQRASDGRAAFVIELVYLSRRLEQHATQTRREIAAGERDVHWTTILRWEQRAIDDLAEHLGWERAGEEEAE